MRDQSERLFLLGVLAGGLFGFIVGSVVAMQLGDRTARLARREIDRRLHRGPRVRFDLLLQ